MFVLAPGIESTVRSAYGSQAGERFGGKLEWNSGMGYLFGVGDFLIGGKWSKIGLLTRAEGSNGVRREENGSPLDGNNLLRGPIVGDGPKSLRPPQPRFGQNSSGPV